jgi:hypothetical protein
MTTMFMNLLKAATAVVLTPIAAAVDVMALPASGFDNDPPFRRTEDLLKIAGDNVKKALKS